MAYWFCNSIPSFGVSFMFDGIAALPCLRHPPEEVADPRTEPSMILLEIDHKGIRVNAIAPGWITVENYFKCIPGFTEEIAADIGYKAIPVARCGDPRDIAKLAAFLCSEDASFIIGQTIVADGGTTALMSLVSDFRQESANTFGKGYIPGV